MADDRELIIPWTVELREMFDQAKERSGLSAHGVIKRILPCEKCVHYSGSCPIALSEECQSCGDGKTKNWKGD